MDRLVGGKDPLVCKAPARGEARNIVGFAATFNAKSLGLSVSPQLAS